jgi:hypothetical protein
MNLPVFSSSTPLAWRKDTLTFGNVHILLGGGNSAVHYDYVDVELYIDDAYISYAC